MEDKRILKIKGRPKKMVIRTRIISIRLGDDEYEHISKNARILKRDLSKHIRITLLSNSVQFALTDEDRIHLRKLTGMANNVNQMAKNSHSQSLFTMMDEFILIRNNLNNLIRQIQK